MKTIFTFLMAAAPVLTWGQSTEADQPLKFNPEAFVKIYGFKPHDNGEGVLSFYKCIKDNYPSDFKKNYYPEITPTKKFLKRKDKRATLSQSSLMYQAYGGSYNDRISIQKAFPKCIEQSDIDW